MKYMHPWRGFTLIELLIGIFLASLLFLLLLQGFVLIKQIFLEQQGLARIQENARATEVILQKAIRQSGRMGCNCLGAGLKLHIQPGIHADEYGLDDPQCRGVSSKTLIKNSQLSKTFFKRLLKDSDILWLKEIKRTYGIRAFDPTQAMITLGSPHALKPKHLLILSDCQQADIIAINTVKGRQITYSPNPQSTQLSKAYPSPTLGKLGSTLYYVGRTYRQNEAGSPIHSLYSTDLNGRTVEWIEGVEQFQVLYGVKDPVWHYVRLEQIKDWRQVKSIHVSILFTSVEDCLRKPRAYTLRGKTITPPDRLLRTWWHYEWPVL